MLLGLAVITWRDRGMRVVLGDPGMRPRHFLESKRAEKDIYMICQSGLRLSERS